MILVADNLQITQWAAAGLSMALLNIFHAETVKTVKAATVLLSTGIFSWEEVPSK